MPRDLINAVILRSAVFLKLQYPFKKIKSLVLFRDICLFRYSTLSESVLLSISIYIASLILQWVEDEESNLVHLCIKLNVCYLTEKKDTDWILLRTILKPMDKRVFWGGVEFKSFFFLVYWWWYNLRESFPLEIFITFWNGWKPLHSVETQN